MRWQRTSKALTVGKGQTMRKLPEVRVCDVPFSSHVVRDFSSQRWSAPRGAAMVACPVRRAQGLAGVDGDVRADAVAPTSAPRARRAAAVLSPHVRPLSAAAPTAAPLHLCFVTSPSVFSLFFSIMLARSRCPGPSSAHRADLLQPPVPSSTPNNVGCEPLLRIIP